MDTFTINQGEGFLAVELRVVLTENGISGLLTGGSRPHVGGMVLSVPRVSLTGSGIGCDSWIIPVPGHKDVVAAERAADLICRFTGEAVALTAGIHIDHAKQEEVNKILENCLEAARLAAARCQELRKEKKIDIGGVDVE